jgi:nitrate/nitrite transport system ATP-binding protein
MEVDIPRPRTRRALLDHPNYYKYRQVLLSFLDEYEHGAAGRPAAARSAA